MRIIDGDGHIWEDARGISKFLPEMYKRSGSVALDRLFPPIDYFHFHVGTPPPGSFSKVDRTGWLEFVDAVGIDAAVLFPSIALGYGRIPYRDWAIAVCRAYNDWLCEEYLSYSSRFHGLALIPMQEPQAACAELRRAVEDLGMSGAVLPATGLKDHLGAKDYWPVYEEADRLGCCLAIHGGSHAGLGFDHIDLFAAAHALGHPVGLMINFTGIIFNGLLEKFPNTRWGFLEGGVAWLLTLLERLDRSYQTQTPFNPRSELVQLAEGETLLWYMKQHLASGRLFIGSEGNETTLPYLCQELGSTPFVFSSDFPHEINPEMCKEEIHELTENPLLGDAAKQAIFHANAELFYGIN